MSYSKINLDGVGFKEPYHTAGTTHIFAEVVLIDKSPPTVQPILYQLKIEHLNEEEIICLGHEDFLYVGEIQSINKARKQIILTNQSMVTYHHLIVSASPNPGSESMQQNEEFHAGLQTLIEALKVRKKLPAPLSMGSPVSKAAKKLIEMTRYTSKSSHPGQETLPNPHQLKLLRELGSIDLGTSTRRVYLVEMG